VDREAPGVISQIEKASDADEEFSFGPIFLKDETAV
jgi:hypothetical protein